MDFPGLSFLPGLKLQEEILHKFGAPISRSEVHRSSFALVVAFGRSKFKLSPATAGILLQSAIGGTAAHFNVSQIGERTFKFWVFCNSVGFFVVGLRSFSCDSFKAFFFLWGNGSQNWRLEYKLFIGEEARAWVPASSKVDRRSFVEVAKTPILSGVNAVPIGPNRFRKPPSSSPAGRSSAAPARLSIFKRIVFPSPAAQSNAADRAQTAVCSRCLMTGHWRTDCH